MDLVTGDPLNAASVETSLPGADTLVHLVGVPKPSPAKARQFREIDLASIRATVDAVERVPSRPHLVYLSVAQPAPVMKAYVAARQEGEALIRARGLDATFLRPWYVLGPGHRWPCVLSPMYAVLRWFPATRSGAERLGFVTLAQMVGALTQAIEEPARGVHHGSAGNSKNESARRYIKLKCGVEPAGAPRNTASYSAGCAAGADPFCIATVRSRSRTRMTAWSVAPS